MPPPSAIAARLHIVVADDSAPVRAHLVDMLRAVEHVDVVGEAESATGAVSAACSFRPEVVVLDIKMPGGGVAALEQIKEQMPETTVIMLTNHSNALYRKKCIERGASFFFDKTTEFEKVGDVVRSLVAGRA